jgi:hypothetical protein
VEDAKFVMYVMKAGSREIFLARSFSKVSKISVAESAEVNIADPDVSITVICQKFVGTHPNPQIQFACIFFKDSCTP